MAGGAISLFPPPLGVNRSQVHQQSDSFPSNSRCHPFWNLWTLKGLPVAHLYSRMSIHIAPDGLTLALWRHWSDISAPCPLVNCHSVLIYICRWLVLWIQCGFGWNEWQLSLKFPNMKLYSSAMIPLVSFLAALRLLTDGKFGVELFHYLLEIFVYLNKNHSKCVFQWINNFREMKKKSAVLENLVLISIVFI